MKKLLVLLAGFLGFLFFEGFARLIIMFYHRSGFQFYGISHLPANVWIVVILLSVLVSTWLVTMLVLTLLKNHPGRYSLIFGAIFLLWRGFEISNSYQQEPLWYFLGVIALHFAGIYLAWLLYTRQDSFGAPVNL